ESLATNLTPPDLNRQRDIFVHDRLAKQTTRVSVSATGGEADNDSFNASISWDGRYVAFESTATNLVSGAVSRRRHIYVRDRQAGVTSRVSLGLGGAPGNADSAAPAISGDGRYVAFESLASDLVSGDSAKRRDIFVHDRQTGETTRVSVS